MVNAGLIPATVTINVRALFWARVFVHLHLCSECALGDEEQLAWVMRKDSPKLKKFVDEFVETHRGGTSLGLLSPAMGLLSCTLSEADLWHARSALLRTS